MKKYYIIVSTKKKFLLEIFIKYAMHAKRKLRPVQKNDSFIIHILFEKLNKATIKAERAQIWRKTFPKSKADILVSVLASVTIKRMFEYIWM